MKVDVYSNMYNEEFMLPFWLRHYETFADRIFVWDGGSTDNTLKILKSHPKVTLLPRDKKTLDDQYFISVLYPQYEQYSKGKADWVMIADADEFIYHPKMRETLESLLADGVQIIKCAGYSMVSDKLPEIGKGQIYQQINMGYQDFMESKWTIHSPDVTVRYRKGRHGIPYNFRGNYVASRPETNGIKLLHYRYLTKEYIEYREKRNIEENQKAHPEVKVTTKLDGPRTMPNGEKMPIQDWLEKHKAEAVNVL